MFRLNNKGQSLVMFVILIPIILLIITLVYDVGTAIYEKNSLSNTSYIIIDYGLDNIDSVSESELIDIIIKNNDLNYVSVNIDNNVIDVILKKNIKGIVGKIFNFNLTHVSTHYRGYMDNMEKIIERVE